MKKLSALAVPLLAVLFALAPAVAAQANTYQDEAVAALQSEQLYVDSSVSLSDRGAVTSALEGSDVGVAVLPSLAVDSLTPQSFAREILNATPYDTLVVILEGNNQPLSVVYKSAPSEESAKAVYEILTENGNNIDQALVPIIEHLKDGDNAGSAVGSEDSSSTNVVIILLVSLLFCVLLVGITYTVLKAVKGNGTGSIRAKHDTVPNKIAETVPAKLHPLIKQLTELSQQHDRLPEKGLGTDLRTIVRNMQELFTRLSKKGTNGQRGIAEVEYIDKLTKLNEALGENYYMDIVNKPSLWDKADTRLDSVAEAVHAVQSQLIENIKQVNASEDLKFQVNLISLVGASKATNVKDIYTPDLKRKNN